KNGAVQIWTICESHVRLFQFVGKASGPARMIHAKPDHGHVETPVLSRFPIDMSQTHDLSYKSFEPRGCFQVDVQISESQCLHVFNVHLGTTYAERWVQAQVLISSKILENPQLRHPRIMLGDFNDWTQGPVSRLLARHLVSADVGAHLRCRRTYPGLFPLVHLDHVYFD